ncbi:hypothetical protein [Pseudomonas sp.]|uniref:hypothetical protein n=1 Tax=Pseudomonas sp. TaxID=306 RepID=UPI002FCBFE24
MTDKPLKYGSYSYYEETGEYLPLSPQEIEVRLAIAEFVIRRVSGTPDGKEIFDGLIRHFENRYPHHKLLAHYLSNPNYIESEPENS